MRTRVYIIAILSIAVMKLSAQTYGTTYTPAVRDYGAIQNQQAIQSQQIMATGNAYNGTVYEPFSAATPSEYNNVGSGESSEGNKSGKHIRTFINPSDPGNQSNESPIGEPWVLLGLALVYGVGCTVYKRRKQKRMSE